MGEYSESANAVVEVKEHPSKDKTSRYAVDALIRQHGYMIWSRQKGYQPVWIKDGTLFYQSDVIRNIGIDRVKDALYLEELEKELEKEGLE